MGQASSFAGFTSVPDAKERTGVYSYDVQKGVTRGDERLAELFGVQPEDCARGISVETFFAAMHPDDRERVTQAVQHAVREGSEFVECYRTLVGSGDGLPVRATGICFRDEDNRPSVFVGMVEPDATEVRDNVDRTIEYALAAYRLAGHSKRPVAQYLIALALEDMGFVLPAPGLDH